MRRESNKALVVGGGTSRAVGGFLLCVQRIVDKGREVYRACCGEHKAAGPARRCE
jgi:hypothetical protein